MLPYSASYRGSLLAFIALACGERTAESDTRDGIHAPPSPLPADSGGQGGYGGHGGIDSPVAAVGGGGTAGQDTAGGVQPKPNDGGVQPDVGGAASDEVPSDTDDARLAPLGISAQEIEAANGAALLALGDSIGLAGGYALCQCFVASTVPTPDEAWLHSCAAEERGPLRSLNREAFRACLMDGAANVADFDATLHCRIQRHQSLSLEYVEHCPMPFEVLPAPPLCAANEALDSLWGQCLLALDSNVEGEH